MIIHGLGRHFLTIIHGTINATRSVRIGGCGVSPTVKLFRVVSGVRASARSGCLVNQAMFGHCWVIFMENILNNWLKAPRNYSDQLWSN